MTNSCKKIFFIAVLFTLILGCTIFSTPFSAYADDSIPPELGLDNSNSSSTPISAEEDYVLRESSKIIAESIYSSSDVRATDYAQQIYNYLYSNIAPNQVAIYQQLGGNASVTLYKYVQRIANGLGMTSNTATGYFADFLAHFRYNNFSSGPTLMDMMYLITSYFTGDSSSLGYSWDTMGGNLATIAGNSGGTVLAINGLSNKLDQLNTLSYTDVTSYFQLLGISETFDGTYTLPTSNTTLDSMYLKIHVSGTVNTFNGLKIRLPISYPYNQIRTIKMYVKYIDEQIEVPIEYLVSMNNVYILDCPDTFATADIYLYIDANPQPARITYSPSASVSLKVEVCSDSVSQKEYYADLATLDINRKLSALDIIKNEIASPDLVEAKEESSPTTKQALDDFTGDGSSAATPSDVSSASDISDSVSSGVDAGGAVSDALTVFNPAAAFFGWFSQDCANYFIPYQPTRGNVNDWSNVVWTDEVPDLLTPMNKDVQNQIGDDK